MERFISRAGELFVRAENVIPGMKLDFDGDPYADLKRFADPDGDHPPSEFEFEFAQVLCVERETPGTVVIHTTQGSFGFPPEHEIETTADQLPVALVDSTKEGDESIVAYYETVKHAEADIEMGILYGEDSAPLDPNKVAEGLYHIDSEDEA